MVLGCALNFSRSCFWSGVNLLGQAEIILPILVLITIWMLWHKKNHQIKAWLLPLSATSLLTLASKIAYIGWGSGIAIMDFTVISGHSLLASGVWPVITGRVINVSSYKIRYLLLFLGYLLAAMVATSTVVLKAHSLSEAGVGFVLGVVTSFLAIRGWKTFSDPAPHWLSISILVWVVIALLAPPPTQIRQFLISLSTYISGKPAHKVEYDPRFKNRGFNVKIYIPAGIIQ